MIVTFQFNTADESFDNTELEAHYQATQMAMCLYDIENKLRSWDKYDERPAIPTEEIRETILDIIQSHVDMEKLGY